MSFVLVGGVRGITCLDNKLYVVYHSPPITNIIGVFTDTLGEFSVITVDGLRYPYDIVACRDDDQLHVADEFGSIWRVSAVNPSDQEKWLRGDGDASCALRLSLTSRRLLLTRFRSLRQYSTTNKQLLRVIELPDSMRNLHHAVETTRGTFVVSLREPSSAVSELFSYRPLYPPSERSEIGRYTVCVSDCL